MITELKSFFLFHLFQSLLTKTKLYAFKKNQQKKKVA